MCRGALFSTFTFVHASSCSFPMFCSVYALLLIIMHSSLYWLALDYWGWSFVNPLRPIADLAAIIDSTYSRRHKKCKKCSRKVKSSLFAKDDFTWKKPPVFRRALPTKTYSTGGILKGVSPC